MEKTDDFLFEEDRSRECLKKPEIKPVSPKKSWVIMIVDDEADVHEVTRIALRRLVFDGAGMEFLSAYSAADAQTMLQLHPETAVILLDVVMESENAGLDLVHFIREEMGNHMIQIILRTGHPGQAPEENVTIDYEINDYHEKSELTSQKLKTAVITALRAYRSLITNIKLTEEIEKTQREFLFALGEIAEFRSPETGNHVKRVGEITRILAQKLNAPEEEIELLRLAAALHDLGKTAISDSILNKPAALTSEEYAVMQTHSQIGYRLLKPFNRPVFQMAALIAKEHHENYDGTGYPDGLQGETIHIYSRIVALTDVFDALGNKRVYKDAWPQTEILDYIQAQKGKKFDPQLVELFFANFDEVSQVRRMFPD